jgi:hypothetical protein
LTFFAQLAVFDQSRAIAILAPPPTLAAVKGRAVDFAVSHQNFRHGLEYPATNRTLNKIQKLKLKVALPKATS